MHTPKFKFALLAAGLLSAFFLVRSYATQPMGPDDTSSGVGVSEKHASAVFAGGCFWCVETDLEKAPGVINVVSGYSGGRTKNPTYKNYASGGHREVVLVVYDPSEVTYAGLVEYLIKHIDPTNRRGQFNDRGVQYSPAVYYETEQEKEAAERVIAAIDDMRVYRGKVQVAVEERSEFWPAEEYHQDYHSKNSIKYNYFRYSSGRDAFVRKHWGHLASELQLPGAYPDADEATGGVATATGTAETQTNGQPWLNFRKPSELELKQKLTAIQFKVTQQDGTEPAFRNEMWDNKKSGIYVDVVSGAPLFSSAAKFDSGTGWPSFTEPLSPDAVVYKVDRGLLTVRTEVRSRYGDSHLGHVFGDGPRDRGGKRYCMNSAAMRFIPKQRMEQEGYGEYLKFVD